MKSLSTGRIEAPTVPDELAACDLQIRVRYAECDPMGYLHHARYFEYFEMGRMELLRRAGLAYRDFEQRGQFVVVAHAEARFRAPVRYDDLLDLHTAIARRTRARIDHVYRLTRDGQLLCEARTTVACVDREGRLTALPDELLDAADGAR